MNDINTYRPFSSKVLTENRTFTRDVIFLYLLIPGFLVAFLPIIDYMLSAKGLVYVVGSIASFAFAFKKISKELKRLNKPYSWVKGTARVLSKEIIDFTSICKPPLLRYRIKVIYTYTYQETLYKSDTFALGVFGVSGCNYFFSEVEEAIEYADRLIRDNKVTVYINPENPKESVIKRGVSREVKPYHAYLFLSYLLVVAMGWILFL